MASRALAGELGVMFSSKFTFSGGFRTHQKMLRKGGRLLLTRLHYCTSSTLNTQDVEVSVKSGLPVITVPLPSRHEHCQFSLKPVTNTLADLYKAIQNEDKGVDRVIAYATDGTRVAGSTTIDILLRSEFHLLINDQKYLVQPPEVEVFSSEHAKNISDLQNVIAQLYSTLNVEQYQLEREKDLQSRLELLKTELEPLEQQKMDLVAKAHERTHRMAWLGLGFMSLQFGILARLTWWEYSWDIMEPVTYFVTYGTSMAMYAYYVLTRQEYSFPDVRDREFLLSVHRQGKKKGSFDIYSYNKLRDQITQAELDLERLRDPLQLQLPIQQILPKDQEEDDA